AERARRESRRRVNGLRESCSGIDRKPRRDDIYPMFLSIFDIFKLGVGPPSSHPMGPRVAAKRFIDEVSAMPLPAGELSLRASLFGSLAYTGEGHGTFRAVLCGLVGMTPEDYDRAEADRQLAILETTQRVRAGGRTLCLDPNAAIV